MSTPAEELTSAHALMQGSGFYNRHGWMQAGGVAAALPALARAADAVPCDGPLMIADYGSSQGRNSLLPMRMAIDGLRARAPVEPITVAHVDQPANDFASLFVLLNDNPESYLRTHTATFATAVGRSFFGPVLPPSSVTLGWSSMAVMWLASVPPEATGQVFAEFAPSNIREVLRRQGDADWRHFLEARSDELRPGGRLVILVAGPREGGSTPLKKMATVALRQLADDGRPAASVCARAFVPMLLRSLDDLRAPFASGSFAALEIEELETRSDVPDAAWERYRQDGDVGILTEAYLGFFKATFLPSLLHSLGPPASADERHVVAAAVEAEIRRSLAATPQPCAQASFNIIVVRRG